VNFIAVLHGFTSLGMVFVATLLSAFALLFAFSIVLSVLGLASCRRLIATRPPFHANAPLTRKETHVRHRQDPLRLPDPRRAR
jgi:hypothetical protein